MKITKTSLLTGITRTIDFDVTPEQLQLWQNGALIQDVMPNLTAEQREFLISGSTQEEWDEAYPEEEE